MGIGLAPHVERIERISSSKNGLLNCLYTLSTGKPIETEVGGSNSQLHWCEAVPNTEPFSNKRWLISGFVNTTRRCNSLADKVGNLIVSTIRSARLR